MSDSATSVTSTARVRLSNPGRYGKQLANHFGEFIDADWDSDSQRGTLTFPAAGDGSGTAACDVIGTDGVLMFSVEGADADVEIVEREVSVRLIQLAREGEDGGVVVEWSRNDGGEARFS